MTTLCGHLSVSIIARTVLLVLLMLLMLLWIREGRALIAACQVLIVLPGERSQLCYQFNLSIYTLQDTPSLARVRIRYNVLQHSSTIKINFNRKSLNFKTFNKTFKRATSQVFVCTSVILNVIFTILIMMSMPSPSAECQHQHHSGGEEAAPPPSGGHGE